MPRNLWLILVGMVINVTGASFLWPLNTIYLHEELGKSLSVAGLVLMANSGASVIGNLAGGYFFDKFGGYKTITFGAGVTLVTLFGLLIWHGWPHYSLFLVIIGFGSGVVNPAMFSLAGVAWKEGGRRTFNAMYVAQNIGVAVGTALAGYIASISFQLIFLANFVLYLIFFLLAFISFKSISTDADAPSMKIAFTSTKKEAHQKRHFIALLIISIGYAICWVAYVQWQTTIATYTQEINVSLEQYSLLWTVNGALIVFAQPIMAEFVRNVAKTLKIQIYIGLLIFIFSFIIASYSTNFTGFLTAMVILTFGEMLVWPAIPTIADQLATRGKAGMYQGIVNSAATVGRMIGPLFGGIVVELYGMNVLFQLLIILFGFAMITTFLYDRGLRVEKLHET
ncbi:MDR family MFS transporter [Fervidibacillus halotolerans]|uniref:MFS transporter n=1 Tax=Fervidibacillus halotolerans TaxID=2980027 RepID=A0A9E8LY05_9BACI|nr:MFS transporter [Fervidibacillus halotolerans]WAA11772.1 MFS transporter [Fervidibacillus halotolerans]